MKRLTLNESMREDAMSHCNERIQNSFLRDHHVYNYISDGMLQGTFDWYLKHRLTVTDNASAWYYQNGKKQMKSYGFSGSDINHRIDESEMEYDLWHWVFCLAEYAARTTREGKDYTLSYYDREFYNLAKREMIA